MTKSLLASFKIFATKAIEKNNQGVKRDEIRDSLSFTQYGEFNRLRFFGLIEQNDREGGKWFLTSLGLDFFSGTKPIISIAGAFNKQPLPPYHPAWATEPRVREEKFITDIFPGKIEKYPDYREQATK